VEMSAATAAKAEVASPELDRPLGEPKAPETAVEKLKFSAKQHACSAGWVGDVKHVRVRAAAGLTADHLKEPSLWSEVQANKNVALRKFDHIEVIAFDESWIASAIAVDCRRSGVQLANIKITPVAQRFDKYLETDDLRVQWDGLGYSVVRKADGHKMSRSESDVHLAERHLIELSRGNADKR
jgi:hypothetical protein